MRILVVDPERVRAERLAVAAARTCPAATVSRAAGDADPVRAAADLAADVVVVGPGCTDGADVGAVVRALAARGGTTVLVASERDSASAAVASLHAGATDYVVLRDGTGALEDALRRLVHPGGGRLPARPAARAEPADALVHLVGRSAAMEQLRTLVRTAAHTDAHVLLEGETGTGKEVVARALHALGRRAAGPFVPVNCAAVPEALAESEFFGHARGAFTGALQERPGAVASAERGTLFLDEIEELPLALQAKLLRVVQDREVRPLGGSTLRRVDVRLVAASNRDLWRMVEAGAFRRDLYYRLRVFTIALPPLRQRRDDIPLLVGHFVERFNRRHGTALAPPAAAALRALTEHDWPGNVRELENAIESVLILAQARGLDPTVLLRESGGPTAGVLLDERARILRVLDAHRWNRQRAASALGISRVTLWRRMERHGIRDPLGGPARETG
jgi:two-component system NtrC family response regulator